jgi:hypothetical protein
MPGAFAHMIAADLAKTALEKKKVKLPTLVLNRHPRWLQADAVGPDYPSFHHTLTSHDASDSWADLLHYTKTSDVVRAGIRVLRERYPNDKIKKDFQRALAWLGWQRRLLTRWEYHAENFLGIVRLVSIKILLNRILDRFY